MEKRASGGQSVARREFLLVPPARENVRRRSVTPITLERRWISMEKPASTTSSSADTSNTATPTRRTSPTTAASSTIGVTTTTTTTFAESSQSQRPRSKEVSPASPRAVVASTSSLSTGVTATRPSAHTDQDVLQTSRTVTTGETTSVSSVSGSQTLGSTTQQLSGSQALGSTTSQLSGSQALGSTTPQLSGSQALGSTTPLLGHRQGSSPTSSRPMSAATEVLSPTKAQKKTFVGGQKRPPEAEGPNANISTTTPREEGDVVGVRPPPASHGRATESTTKNQAEPKECTLAPTGQHLCESSTLSTGDPQASRTSQGQGDRGREAARKGGGSRLAVQFSDDTPSSSPRPSPRDVGDVMQFFAEQEKSLQESFLSLPKRPPRKQRSPSPKVSPAPGLEHLDNLVRLMEQLGSLKDENSRLRQRCHYLESTKVLLQARKDLATFEAGSTPVRFKTLPTKQQKQRHLHHRHHHHHQRRSEEEVGESRSSLLAEDGPTPASRRSRISSAEELEYLEFGDSSSDQRPKRPKSGLPKRSFSTGSLEVPSELLFPEVSEGEVRKRMKSKAGRSIFSSKSGTKSKSSKSGSKWARVKKVLTGQKIYEDLGTTIRTIRDLGKSTGGHSRHSTSGASISPADVSPPSSQVYSGEQRPVESGAHSDGQGPSLGGVAGRNPLVVVPLVPRVDAEGTSRSEQEGSDPELTCDIWMGPPDWWEEYEARTEGSGRRGRGDDGELGVDEAGAGASTTNSEVSSVIEVTTMYLGNLKKDTLQASSSQSSPATTTCSGLTVSMTTSSISSSSTATRTGAVSPAVPTDQQFLTVEKFPLQRRQSSPSLNGKEASEEGEDIVDDLASLSEGPTRALHKSASCQSADLELPRSSEFPGDSRQSHKMKGYRTAWGRVKDIIHTRKDSVKRRPKKQRSGGVDSEETSEIDVEGLYLEEQWRSGSFGEGLLGRSTPKSSPPAVMRQQTSEQSPPQPVQASHQKTRSSSPGVASGMDMAAMLAGSMSDDFNRKMWEWEAKKNRKSATFKVSGEDSDLGSLDVSTASQDVPVRTMDLKDLKGKLPDSSSDVATVAGESHTSLEVLGAHSSSPAQLEQMQKRMTDSFSRKMLEWEKLKYRSSQGSQRESSPGIERKGSKGRKEDRQKSKRSREDKEKEKLEKMREREIQKVEREQLKLEREKLRLEKERLRALEREAKLEKIKGRLSQPEAESGFKNPVLGPLAEYKVTADFAHKLHQWELKKGLSHDVSNSIYLEAQKLNVKHLREETARQKPVRLSQSVRDATVELEEQRGRGQAGQPGTSGERPPTDKDPPLAVGDGDDEAEDGGEKEGEGEAEGDEETSTSATEECLVKSNIDTLERANRQLIENLQQKEMEYEAVQQQVTEVNRKLAKVKEEHAKEMARFHRELALGSIAEPVKLEVGELENTISSMEEKIKAMENLGERLALSMESAAVGKWQSIDGEETVHTQLIELVEQMRNMLVQASHSEEESKKSMALSNFEKLYSHAMKLQVQMNNLRLSHLERNREIMTVKRQLLLQEVNNLLLQADITRRETELYQYQAAKKFASLRRWNTFGGSDRSRPQAQMEITPKPRIELQPEGTSKQSDTPHVHIPYIPEEVILASAASSSISAPASPSAVEAAGGTPHSTTSGVSLLPHHQHHHHLIPTTSSAAGGSAALYHVTPSSVYVSHQHSHHPHQPHTSQQRDVYHSSRAVTSGAPLSKRPCLVAESRDSSHHQLSPGPPTSPSFLRAVSDPVQAGRKEQSGREEPSHQPSSAESLKPSSNLTSTIHPSSISRSVSDGENISSRHPLSLSPARQEAPPRPSSPELKVPGASGAVGDQGGHAGLPRYRSTDAPSVTLQHTCKKQQQQQQQQDQPGSPAVVQGHITPPSSVPITAAGAEPTTRYDSVPLYHELRELRRAKNIVEKGSPTLILSKEGKASSSVPSPGKSHPRGDSGSVRPQTPPQTIPRQSSLEPASSTAQAPRLTRVATNIDDDCSPAASVMTCTDKSSLEASTDHTQSRLASESHLVASASTRLSPRADSRRDLPPTNEAMRLASGKCPRSPITKHNYLRRQKEERDTATSTGKHLDYKAISPKGSPVPTRGKPPLPRQNTPVRQSPHASPAAPEKGPRSKSVGEVCQGNGGTSVSHDSGAHKPLQDAINRFEKRQTMCETDERPLELRKTPSPTLHLPRVGLVSRVRRLKPAAELLEESQKFKSGHSIYATRIMHRYLPKEGNKPLVSEAPPHGPIAAESSLGENDKENNFVHTMVRRLSRETSPVKSAASSRTTSELSLKRTDSPRSNSEFVSHIVRKLSSGSGSGSPRYKASPTYSPFKDRTNDGQVKKIAQCFDEHQASCSPDKALSDSDLDRPDPQSPPARRRFHQAGKSSDKVQHRKSCEVAMVLSLSSAATTSSSHVTSTTDQSERQQHAASSSPTTPPNHQSLPALALASDEGTARHRAATYSQSEKGRQVEREPQPVRPASTSSAYDPHGHQLTPEVTSSDRSKGGRSGRSAASSLSPVRRGTGRGKMGTVRVLCKQSISFDLGVSLYSHKAEAAGGGSPKSTRQVRSWDPSESLRAETAAASVSETEVEVMSKSSPGPSRSPSSAHDRPLSSGSEGEAATPSLQAEEKTKFRRFLDSSKKFFKVSK